MPHERRAGQAAEDLHPRRRLRRRASAARAGRCRRARASTRSQRSDDAVRRSTSIRRCCSRCRRRACRRPRTARIATRGNTPNRPNSTRSERSGTRSRRTLSGALFNAARASSRSIPAATKFAASLQVFDGGYPSSFDRTASSPPADERRRLRLARPQRGTRRAGVVSFLTRREQRYFLEAGVAPRVGKRQRSRACGSSMRILDITPPAVTVRANDATQDASKVFSYGLSTNDPRRRRPAVVKVTQIHGGRAPDAAEAVPLGTSAATERRESRGSACTASTMGDAVFVRWRTIHPPVAEFGRVTASLHATGREHRHECDPDASCVIPRRRRSSARRTSGGTAAAGWSCPRACIRGPGSIQVEVHVRGPPRKAGTNEVSDAGRWC